MANPLNNFNFQGGVDSVKQRLKAPLNNFFSAQERNSLLKAAHDRHDFKGGFVITPINKDGKEVKTDIIRLVADAMPHDNLSFGGQQKIVKDYYPGSSEPTVQVLGPQENDITIKGRFKAKRLRKSDATDEELWRKYPVALQEQIEAVRVSGLLVRLDLGEAWKRYGFIQEAVFNMKTLADIEYTITFLIVGFNQPKDFIIVTKQATVPYNANKELAKAASDLLNQASTVPDSMPLSFADQITAAVNDVAAAANLVTGFVDNVLAEVDSLKASVQRALGLIKNARSKISNYQRTVGANKPEGNVSKDFGVRAAYTNAQFVASVSSSMFSLNAFLASLAIQLRAVTLTVPIARHRVQALDTLQSIAIKYYNDSSKWEIIYDHNRLTSSTLSIGSILEIPRE